MRLRLLRYRPEDLIATILALAPFARRSAIVIEMRSATVEQEVTLGSPVDERPTRVTVLWQSPRTNPQDIRRELR